MRRFIKENLKVLVISLLLAVAGCVMVNELALYRERPVKFSHAVHGEKAELSCGDCHTKALDSDDAGMPTAGTCRLCHESKEDIEKYLKPFVVEGSFKWTNVTDIPEEVAFSHKLHADKKVGCEDCHRGVQESEAVSEKFRVEKDACLACHGSEKMSGDCATCHQEVDREWQPPSHSHNWEKFHGQVARAEIVPPYENRCSLCHTDETCATCHQVQMPRSHNNHWRQRGHGISARMDRDSCATCHRSDYCDRCHRDTAPRNHVGAWGEPAYRHCYVCHFPVDSDGCGTCHKVLGGHMGVPALPNNVTHMTASDFECRDCHVTLGTLTHPDSGDSCRNCHQ